MTEKSSSDISACKAVQTLREKFCIGPISGSRTCTTESWNERIPDLSVSLARTVATPLTCRPADTGQSRWAGQGTHACVQMWVRCSGFLGGRGPHRRQPAFLVLGITGVSLASPRPSHVPDKACPDAQAGEGSALSLRLSWLRPQAEGKVVELLVTPRLTGGGADLSVSAASSLKCRLFCRPQRCDRPCITGSL